MEAGLPALHRFSEVPYVIEAAPSSGRLSGAAATAMGSLRVGIDPKGLGVEAYRAVLSRLRDDIRGRIPGSGKYRLEVMDRTADDLAAEGRRVGRTLSGYADALKRPAGKGAFATPFDPTDGFGCAITGFPADADFSAILSKPVGGVRINDRGLTAETLHWLTLRHELGHCLLGSSESRADAFSALLAIRDGKLDRDQIAFLASFREVSEWTNPNPDDDHFTSAVLWEIAARHDSLKADPLFMALSVEEIAGAARATSDRYGLDHDGVEDTKAIKRAIRSARAPSARAVAPERRPAALQEWMAANSAKVSVLKRIETVVETFVQGGRALSPFKVDLVRFKEQVSALADEGDATALAMTAALSARPRRTRESTDFASKIPLARRNVDLGFDDPEGARRGFLRGTVHDPAGSGLPAGPR